MPSVGLALNGLGAAELRYASGLFNLIRNLGGSIGVATVNAWLQDNTRIAPMSGDLDQAGRLAQSEFGQLVGRVASTVR